MKRGFVLPGVVVFVGRSNSATSATLQVCQDSPSPGPPYGSWAKAATNIQKVDGMVTDGNNWPVTNRTERIYED